MRWKRWLFPGLSGALIGIAAVVARRRRSRKMQEAPEPIPEEIEEFEIETERLELTHQERSYQASARYLCRPTRFQVWSVLGSAGASDGTRQQRIFHISPTKTFRPLEGEGEEVVREEQFYATIHARVEDKQRRVFRGCVARGALVEFHKCHVGGSLNGVESGEKLTSIAPVSDYRFRLPNP